MSTPSSPPPRRAKLSDVLPFVQAQLHRRARAAVDRTAAGHLDEGVALVKKDARPNGFDLWIGAIVTDPNGAIPDPMPLTLRVRADGNGGGGAVEKPVTLRWYRLGEDPVPGVPEGVRFFHGHVGVHELPAGSYEASVQVPWIGGQVGTASASVRTLPGPLSQPGDTLRVMVGSCYDAGTDPDDRLDRAYAAVFGDHAPPDLTLLLGDQVYADSPLTHYLLRSRQSPRSGLLLKYWTAWGMSSTAGRRGLRGVLQAGPNYFLPDDHEFWNNWPNQSVTAKHSYRNVAAAIRNGRLRRRAAIPDDDPAVVPIPPNPAMAPTDPRQQNYLPVHPAEWQKWSLASFELFGSFQTRSEPDRATGQASLGVDDESVAARSAIPPGPPTLHRPRNPIVQIVTIDPVTFCLLDTRTRRTRSLRHPTHSAFVDTEYLDQMITHAKTAAVFVLVTPQPLLTPAGYSRQHAKPERFGLAALAGDTGMQDYWHQWQDLWTRLIAARRGRPIVTLGGDIHQSYVAEVPNLNLVEVVSSPMSLVWGGNAQRLGQRILGTVTGRRGPDYRPDREFVSLADVVAGPRPATLPSQPPGHAVSRGRLRWNREGFAELTFARSGPSSLDLLVVLHDRDAAAGGNDADGPPVQVKFPLVLEA